LNKRFFVALACTLLAGGASAAERALPHAAFTGEGVTVSGLRAGTRVAWLGMIREPRGTHSRTRIVRGFEPVTPKGSFAIIFANADQSRGIWAIADVGTGASIHARSPRAVVSARPIPIAASVGGSTVVIEGEAIELLYVRPPAKAWTFAVSDGGGLDADGTQNGTIVVALTSLKALHGGKDAPSSVERGDVLLLLDPRVPRTATVEIQ
jgi:hypothetical protein